MSESGTVKPSMNQEGINQPESGPEFFQEKEKLSDDKLSDDLSLTSSQTHIDTQLLERAEGVAIQVLKTHFSVVPD